jgi:hypothetical protein
VDACAVAHLFSLTVVEDLQLSVPMFLILFFRGGTPKIIIPVLRNNCLYKRKQILNRRLLAHGDWLSHISNCVTKLTYIYCTYIYIYIYIRISRGIFMIFCDISKQLYICSIISVGTPNGVLRKLKVPRNPFWETLVYKKETCLVICITLLLRRRDVAVRLQTPQ